MNDKLIIYLSNDVIIFEHVEQLNINPTRLSFVYHEPVTRERRVAEFKRNELLGFSITSEEEAK